MNLDTCRDIREMLVDFSAGRLDNEARDTVDAHLRVCPECAAEARTLCEATEILRTQRQDLPVPAGLKAKILARARENRRPAGTRIAENPRYQALSRSLPEQVKQGFKRHSLIFAASLCLNAAAAVVVVVLALRLNRDSHSPQVQLNPIIADNPARRAVNRIYRERADRPAVLWRGARTAQGALVVNVAQFIDNAEVTLRLDRQIGCVQAFLTPGAENGLACAIRQGKLTVPAQFSAFFGPEPRMRIIEMEKCLELWPEKNWEDLAMRNLLASAPRPAEKDPRSPLLCRR